MNAFGQGMISVVPPDSTETRASAPEEAGSRLPNQRTLPTQREKRALQRRVSVLKRVGL